VNECNKKEFVFLSLLHSDRLGRDSDATGMATNIHAHQGNMHLTFCSAACACSLNKLKEVSSGISKY